MKIVDALNCVARLVRTWTSLAALYFRPPLLLLATVLLSVTSLPAADTHNVVIGGAVIRSSDKSPLAGASIRVQGERFGAYADRKGQFRLHLTSLPVTLVVRSVGSHQRQVTVASADTLLIIELTDAPITARDVQVVGEIGVDEIVRRAIARRRENRQRVKRSSSLVVTRRVMNERMTSFGTATSHPTYQMMLARYDVVNDSSGSRMRKVVLERAESKSTSEKHEVDFVSPFDDFDSDTLQLDSILGDEHIRIIRPLASEATKHYSYTLLERRTYSDKFVYVISFTPLSRLEPAFEGTMHVIEGSYDVVAAYYKVTQETAIPLADSAMISQRYEEVADNIWMPSYSSMSIHGTFNGLFGLLQGEVEMSITSSVLQCTVNTQAPDSLFAWSIPDSAVVKVVSTSSPVALAEGRAVLNTQGSAIVVDYGANTQHAGQWDSLTVVPPSESERTLMTAADTTAPRKGRERRVDSTGIDQFRLFTLRVGPANVHVLPVLSRTPATGLLYGAKFITEFGSFSFDGNIATSTGMSTLGSVAATYTLPSIASSVPSITMYARNNLAMIQPPQATLGSLVNASMLVYGMSRDYVLAQGFGGTLGGRWQNVSATATIEKVRHSPAEPVEQLGRPTPHVQSAAFTIGRIRLAATDSSIGTVLGGVQRRAFVGLIEAGSALNHDVSTTNVWVLADGSLRVPTFSTGYEDMSLRFACRARFASNATPGQFLFYSTPRFSVGGDINDLLTIPLNRYAGNRQYQIVVEHNFSDYVWRASGLALFRRRGLDIIATYAAARFEHSGVALGEGMVQTKGWYQEVGVGIDRIPTMLLDYVYLRAEFRTPIGELRSTGRSFGWSVGVTSPLF